MCNQRIDLLQCVDICAGRKLSLGDYQAPCVCDRDGVPAGLPKFQNPDLQSLLRYWLSLREDGGVPERTDFDPIRIPSLLSRFWIVRREAESGRYRFLLAGEQIRNLLGRRVAECFVEDLFPGHEEAMRAALAQVLDTPAIHYTIGPLYRAGLHPVPTERLALPMAENGQVNTVYGATLYRKPTKAAGAATEYVHNTDAVVIPVKELPCRGCLLV